MRPGSIVNATGRLAWAAKVNKRLYRAYLLQEQLRQAIAT
jgi:hypothetical protein